MQYLSLEHESVCFTATEVCTAVLDRTGDTLQTFGSQDCVEIPCEIALHWMGAVINMQASYATQSEKKIMTVGFLLPVF